MASEWWLIDDRVQRIITKRIDAAASAVLAHFDLHGSENALTAALGQELLGTTIDDIDTQVRFTYRKFSDRREEPLTGADGAFVITIRNRERTVKKAVLFQAKRFAQRRPPKMLTLPRGEARRLKHQLNRMVPLSDECIVLAQTREQIYAIDGLSADPLSIEDLKHVTERCRLVSLGTFLGKWVARCSRGDLGEFVISQSEEPNGFAHHSIAMVVDTTQRPRLTSGEERVYPRSRGTRVPKPRLR
jgi:hypothetical protein